MINCRIRAPAAVLATCLAACAGMQVTSVSLAGASDSTQYFARMNQACGPWARTTGVAV